ncbi:hypothetical protein V8E36_009719 [Tilletia maclaganii]
MATAQLYAAAMHGSTAEVNTSASPATSGRGSDPSASAGVQREAGPPHGLPPSPPSMPSAQPPHSAGQVPPRPCAATMPLSMHAAAIQPPSQRPSVLPQSPSTQATAHLTAAVIQGGPTGANTPTVPATHNTGPPAVLGVQRQAGMCSSQPSYGTAATAAQMHHTHVRNIVEEGAFTTLRGSATPLTPSAPRTQTGIASLVQSPLQYSGLYSPAAGMQAGPGTTYSSFASFAQLRPSPNSEAAHSRPGESGNPYHADETPSTILSPAFPRLGTPTPTWGPIQPLVSGTTNGAYAQMPLFDGSASPLSTASGTTAQGSTHTSGSGQKRPDSSNLAGAGHVQSGEGHHGPTEGTCDDRPTPFVGAGLTAPPLPLASVIQLPTHTVMTQEAAIGADETTTPTGSRVRGNSAAGGETASATVLGSKRKSRNSQRVTGSRKKR